MIQKVALSLLFAMFGCTPLFAQQNSASEAKSPFSSMKLGGYLKYMNIVSIPEMESDWLFDNLIHNRLNYKWAINDQWKLQIEMRNRVFYGQSVQTNPLFGELFDESLDYVDLGTNLIESNSFVLHSVFDRANITWNKNKWLVTLGKQRINWSQSFVWNPNDIFNAYSFFDFDYEERRGSDALFIQYNVDRLSSLQFAVSLHDEVDSITTAAYYRFNKLGYDFQFIGGKYQTDLYAGVGWSGQLRTIGFSGELSYFQPYQATNETSTFVGDVSFDYRFPNTLNLRLEAIYNSNLTTPPPGTFFQMPVTAKALTFNHFSVFTSADYELTPLLKIGINSIWNIDDESWFINPTITSSLNENTELLVALQSFGGATGSQYADLGSYLYTRLKFNF